MKSSTVKAAASGEILVIGYGNELRGDDALGPQVAAAVAQLQFDRVRVIRVHQLLPELAESLSAAGAALFIDAALGQESQVEVEPLSSLVSERFMTHRGEPSNLLSLAQAIYGRAPQSWWIKVRAHDCSFRLGLSAQAEEALKNAVAACVRLIQTLAHPLPGSGRPSASGERNRVEQPA